MKMLKNIALLLGLSLAGIAQADGHLTVDDAWVREAPPGAMALAGYMKLHNHADQARVLVGAESPAFESVMLHKTVMEGAMANMVHQHMITIPAKGMVSFEPNSYHLMMMKPKQALKAGDKVSVILRFKNGETQEVTSEVRAAMGGMDHGSHNQGH
jgi:copper(I)-binding protein